MIRRAKRPERNFSVIDNAVIRDNRLSLKARGLLCLILSYPDNWRTDYRSLARECQEGESAIRSALRELREAGYLVQTKARDAKGRWVTETVIFDRPQTSSQVTASGDFPRLDDRASDGPRLYEELDEELTTSVLECVTAEKQAATAKEEFQDWRPEDLELFRSIVGDTMTSDGSDWSVGTFPAHVWYEALRKHKDRPVQWPGRFFASLQEHNGVEDYFANYGVEIAA